MFSHTSEFTGSQLCLREENIGLVVAGLRPAVLLEPSAHSRARQRVCRHCQALQHLPLHLGALGTNTKDDYAA